MGWREESEQLERELLDLRARIQAATPFEQWFEPFSELCKRERDLYFSLFWPTMLDTTDEEAKAQYQQLVSGIFPTLERLVSECLEAALNHPDLPSDQRYQRVIRIWQSQKQPVTSEIADLLGKEQKQVSEYRRLVGQLRVETAEGRVSLGESLSLRKRSTDPAERERLWRLEVAARKEIEGQVDEISLELIRTRQEIARKSGFASYTGYVFNRERRFDYSPQELLDTIRNIRKICRPLVKEFMAFKSRILEVRTVAPWDYDWEIQLEPEASPTWVSEKALTAAVTDSLSRIQPSFGVVAQDLFDSGAADLWGRAGKQTGAWSTYLSTTAQPLVLCNNTGIASDFRFTFHELGHAIHYSHSAKDRPYWLQHATLDINEYVAYTIQCLGLRELAREEVIRPAELSELNLNSLMNALDYIENLVALEEFTHWVYAQEAQNLTADELDRAYLEASAGDGLDWSGLEPIKKKMWHTLRFIPMPFYASEYILAWVMAMLGLERMDQDRTVGLEKFTQILSHSEWGFSKVLSVWEINFPFDQDTLERVAKRLRQEFGFTNTGTLI